LTPSTWAEWVENAFILEEHAPRDKWDEWTGDSLRYESGGERGTYLDYVDPAKRDSRFLGAAFEIDLTDSAFADLEGEALDSAVWEEALEAVATGAADEPAILCDSTFAEWEREERDRRRALNLAPLDMHGPALPLFGAAVGRLFANRPGLLDRAGATYEEQRANLAARLALVRALGWSRPGPV
jgi:hypothetical protein